jgi:hypothetical protein
MILSVTILDAVVLSWNKIILNVDSSYLKSCSILKWTVIIKTIMVIIGSVPFVIILVIPMDSDLNMLIALVGVTVIAVVNMIFFLSVFIFTCIAFYKFLQSSKEPKYILLRNKVIWKKSRLLCRLYGHSPF